MKTAATLQKPTTLAKAAPEPRRGSRTIKEWCEFRHYSIGTFYTMRRNGVAPKVSQPPGAPPRITDEADAAWVVFCENLPADLAAKAAAIIANRHARTISAGAKAAASPLHVSRQRYASRRQRERA
jgi:hypothetical protein